MPGAGTAATPESVSRSWPRPAPAWPGKPARWTRLVRLPPAPGLAVPTLAASQPRRMPRSGTAPPPVSPEHSVDQNGGSAGALPTSCVTQCDAEVDVVRDRSAPGPCGTGYRRSLSVCSGSGPLARRGTATLVMANCTSRLAKVPRSRPLSRDRTRCPRCPASRGTTRCRHRQAVVARVPRRARPVVRIRPQVRPGDLHPRARCRPARQDAAGS